MDLSAAHTGFVVAAYTITGVVLAVLAAFVLFRNRSLRRQLSALEHRKKREH